MPSSQARVATDRAQRYVTRLCGHLGRLSRGHAADRFHRGGGARPPDVRAVETSGGHGRIEFDWGQILLDASPEALTIGLDAADEHALAQAEKLIAHRLQTIGHREDLIVVWSRTA